MKVHKKKIFKFAQGFYGRRRNCWTISIRAVHRAWQYSYISRRLRKRDYRTSWIQRINAGCRQLDFRYSDLVRFLPSAGVDLNRRVLSELAATEPYAFRALVEIAKQQKSVERANMSSLEQRLGNLRIAGEMQ